MSRASRCQGTSRGRSPPCSAPWPCSKRGSGVDAAQHAIEALEDDSRFNAGTGACLNAAGKLELDAAIMEGVDLRAGAVCALPAFRHPIAIARAVLDAKDHVLYAGAGASTFAERHGFRHADEQEMITDAARDRLARLRAGLVDANWAGGTVGVVVRDASGTVVAATSTGGKVGKAPGRVGDSPILGAGTYADNAAGASSCTGDGEAFMRVCLAKTAIEWLRMGMHPDDAARGAIRYVLERAGGVGGIDPHRPPRPARLGALDPHDDVGGGERGVGRGPVGGLAVKLAPAARDACVRERPGTEPRLGNRAAEAAGALRRVGRRLGLAVDRVLHAVAKARRALDAPPLDGLGQPLVTLAHAPKCSI